MDLNGGLILAGIGIFVFGIQLLEKSLRSLMSRRFKLFMKRNTGNPFKAVFGGTIVTAALQSSSVVNFLVLAFAGSGVMTLRNALAVIMGTNLGTTVNSWIVATLGFKIDIEAYALPVAGVAGLVIFIFSKYQRLYTIAQFLLGFSFLFIGLGFMKESVEGDAIRNAMQVFSNSGTIVFLILGFVATTITQSSAATVAITLSLLYQQIVGFDSAMAIVIGSEVGTSVKLILGALDGVPIKQRISAGNFFYNLITTIVAFILLRPAEILITDVFKIEDPLIGLATFQTAMNVFSILLFFPFLQPLSRLLERSFTKEPTIASLFLTHHTPVEPDGALELLHKETGFFVNQCKLFNALNFHVHVSDLHQQKEYADVNNARGIIQKSNAERYELLKEQYGEMQSYYMRVKAQALDQDEVRELDRLISVVRSAMYSSKCIKDLFSDIHEMRNSTEQHFYDFLRHMREDVATFYRQLDIETWRNTDQDSVYAQLMAQLNHAQHQYQDNMQSIYAMAASHTISDVELATMMNFNRELFTSSKSMIMSLKNFLLDEMRAEKFSEVPTYLP